MRTPPPADAGAGAANAGDGARAEVLARIRAALAPSPGVVAPGLRTPPEPAVDAGPGSSRRPRPPGGQKRQVDVPAERVERFVERVEDYRATVTVTSADEVGATVAAICDRHAVARLAVPDGVPAAWIPEGIEVLRVGAVDAAGIRALDAVDGVLTGSALGVAETGTIVLDGGPGQGPRAATLLPDLHVCVVDTTAIVDGVPEMTAAMGDAVRAHGRPLTMISGPSATSDIELDRVEGVHGPRRLEVVVVQD